MRRTVVATTDGSERSSAVFPHAARIAEAAGLDLLVLFVLDDAFERAAYPGRVLELAARRARTVRDDTRRRLRELGISAEFRMMLKPQTMRMPQAIIEGAVEQGGVLLAMESRGQGVLRAAVLGSTTLRVLAASHLPVMVTTEKTATPISGSPYRLLACTDGSADAERIARTLTPLLFQGDIGVSVLTVEEAPAYLPRKAVGLAVDQLPRWFPDRVRVDYVTVPPESGAQSVPAAIVDAAGAEQASAIALSTRGYRLTRRILHGSVGLAVLGESPLPVVFGH